MDPKVRASASLHRLADALVPRTPEEHERRRAHLLALLLVAAVSTGKHVIGLTDGSAQYTLYGVAVALSAGAGGIAPALVATLAAMLLADAGASATPFASRLLFAVEGIGLALVVAGMRIRLQDNMQMLTGADGANQALTRQLRRARIAEDAFGRLEATASDAAVFVVNSHGLIVEWWQSAVRVYGYTPEQMLGSDAGALLSDSPHPGSGRDLLIGVEGDEGPRVGVHRRSDGTLVHVEFAVRRCDADPALFTVAVHDLSTRREIAAFEESSLRAQATLERDIDEARGRLDTVLALTDPAISVVSGGGRTIEELIERLRSALPAEGIALVKVGRASARLVAAAGIRPVVGKAGGPAAGGASDNRIVLVRNDAARVAQVSALQWPSTVSSIVIVPVAQSASGAFRLEVVNERRASASEWDLSLVRIVADRLASVVLLHAPSDSAGAVA